MEKEIKHRLKRSRRRERAERMQAQRDHGDSAEDETLTGVKPHRPPIRRKKTKEPTFEEDIIDGFAILAFRSYEELEMAVKMATTKSTKYNLLEDKIRSQGNLRVINHHSPAPGHDAGTSDDSGRASEVRPPGLPHGHRESSHDHLSDASSRCSSGRGYICDSEGEDDKGSDAGSIFAATPASTPRKSDASEAGGTQTALIVNGVGTPPVAPHQPNGVAENTKTSLSAALLNFSSPQLDKGLSSDAERSAKPRFDNFGLAANEKSRPDVNCSGFEKRLESNTHAECKRLESNTHQNVVNNLEMKLECLPHHVDKGRLDGIQADKNIHFEKNAVLDKSRLDSVNLDKTRVDGIPVHMLDNMSLSHVEKKRTLDVIPNFDKCAKDTKIEKCLENSNVHGPLNLDKRKDSHLAPVLGDKGRLERETSVEHASGNSPTLSNPGPLLPHLNSSVLQNAILHQPAVVAGTNPVSHKPLPSNHIYQNSIRTHLHNPGLPSHNGTSLQFPLKKPVVLHGGPNMPSSVRPSMMPAPSVPTTTTSVSPVISSSTSNTLPLSNVGNATTLPTTLSLSNSGTVSGILQHATLHPIGHVGNQRSHVEPILSHRPGNSPQPGNGSARPPNDSISSGPRVNTPLPQHQVLAPSHPTSHVGSQVVHGRLSPTEVSSSSSTSVTITTAPSGTTATTSSDFPVCSSINVSSTISFHSGSANVTSTSVGTVNQSGGIQEPRSPGMHSGYSLPLPGGSFSYPSLYGPYSTNIQHPSYLPVSSVGSPISKTPSVVSGAIATSTCTASVVASCTTASHRDVLSASASNRIHSPRGHSPTRERDSYSSNVSSLSRGSTTPVNRPPSASPFSTAPSSSLPNPSPYAKNPVWGISTPGPASARSSLHPSNFPAPIFAQPLPPPGGPPGPAPFSAESLFQTNQADLLRRELDNRFLASQERAIGVAPAFLRTEMHHHQHQHTHVHQHQAPALYPPPLFKDIPKLGSVDSPFYRGNLGLVSYPGFSPGLLGHGIPSTPFAPPSHLPTFTPKQVGDASKPRILKTGKWNAMHVRVAWEIYHHQQKQSAENKSSLAGSSSSKETLLRPSGHLFPSSGPRHDLGGYPPGFLPPPPPPHIGATVTPFGRYPPMGSFGAPPSNFPGLAGFSTREIPSLTSIPSVHDPWRLRGPNAFSVSPSPWSLKPEPTAMERREMEEREREREREREKERIRREREERERDRERREREEKRKLELERERREKDRRELEKRELERYNKVRDRSPIRNGDIKEEPRSAKEEDVVILGRTGPGGSYPPHPYGMGRHSGLRPPPLTPHFTPSTWPPPPGADPFAYRLDPLLRYNPLVPFRQEEEDQRSKLYGVGGYPLPPHASHHQSSSPVLMKKEESQSR